MRQLFEQPPALDDERLARFGERDSSPAAVEQLHVTECLLELLDLTSQRGLGDVQPLRRTAEVQLVGDGQERPEVTKLYHTV
jgi:hypothetical protein